ncbi:MAG: hypothetical protein U1F36_14035 [Planctomycetota bacterium]
MFRPSQIIVTSSLWIACLASSTTAQIIEPPFNASYSYRTIGAVPGVPTPYGGCCFKYDDPDALVIGGGANGPAGAIYTIRVVRNASNLITGFQGTATLLATAANIDGGLQYGPNNVLFFTTYSNNTLGQVRPGSTTPDKVISLSSTPGWVGGSTGALSFVPPGYPGAGRFKIASYSSSTWHSCTLTPDGAGTFDLSNLQQTAMVQGGPEGILYVPPGSPLFPNYSRMLLTQFGSSAIYSYDLDANGDPVLATATPFMTGLAGAEGATIDAISGSFVFSTYGGSGVVIVDGFGSCGTFTNYGSGIPGAGGRRPTIRGVGCATISQAIGYQIGNGPASGLGALNIGFQQLSIPIFGGFVLTEPSVPIGHVLDSFGAFSTTLNTPNNPALVGAHIFFQGVYIDPGAPFGVTASDGLDMLVQ